MPTETEILYVGQTIRIDVNFEDEGTPVDPDSVVVTVLDSSGMDTGIVLDIVNDAVGYYYVDWTPQTVGDFSVLFEGTFADGSVVTIEEFFSVLQLESQNALGTNQEIVFLTELSPMYVDPEEFNYSFAEANDVEIKEFVYRYSAQVQRMLKLADGEEPPFLALEYIRAAVRCALYRIYDYGYGGDETSFTLGDLSVTNRGAAYKTMNRGNAANPCELAEVLRLELMRTETGMKAVVKGTKYIDPMPKRHLKHQYGGRR